MSKYTTQIRFICETECGYTENQGGSSAHIEEILTQSAPKIFDFDYPIFDESYRRVLERKILKHYYTREISEETVSLWKLRLNDRMNMIMPFYNQLYESELIEFNPMYDVDLHTERENVSEKNSDKNINTDESKQMNAQSQNNKTNTKNFNENVEQTNTNSLETNTNNNTTYNNLKDELAFGTGDNARKDTTSYDNYSESMEHGKTTTRTESGAEVINNKETNAFSDTPQGILSNTDLAGNDYLTDYRVIEKEQTVSYPATLDGVNSIRQTKDENSGTDDKKISGSHSVEKSGKETTTRTGGVNSTTNSNSDEIGTENRAKENTTNFNESNDSERSQYDERNLRKNENSNVNTLNNYIEHVFGKRNGSSFSQLLLEFRKTFLNIDAMIIDELKDLFFVLW